VFGRVHRYAVVSIWFFVRVEFDLNLRLYIIIYHYNNMIWGLNGIISSVIHTYNFIISRCYRNFTTLIMAYHAAIIIIIILYTSYRYRSQRARFNSRPDYILNALEDSRIFYYIYIIIGPNQRGFKTSLDDLIDLCFIWPLADVGRRELSFFYHHIV